ncbi:hypothetical protein GYMLUDRAFT_48939 [Collybiopsis luxurians FD-317 M1]|uniref:Unplaced genomic scaffold GYMLUscaffold_71, whole genome shotgun sequence n=1 Tax=Collybiopsis luxurians FD-317 M1 TaxID=944289 RepID=A0A0D0BH90_9AGAR|nr:hypothetical protein GYMLUDRAFT_48939 [Collybiopsis luxurians FD-317 M1]
MNEDDLTHILQLGYNERNSLARQVLVSVFFGFYIATSGIAIRLLVRTGLRTRPQQIALFLQLCLLVNCICAFLSSCMIVFMGIHSIFMTGADLSLQDRIAALGKSKVRNNFSRTFFWSGSINLLIGDTLVLWRAWAIWRDNRWVQLLWIVLAIFNAVINILSLTVTVWSSGGPSESFGRAFELNFYLFTSLAVNVLATVAITYKAWLHSRLTNVFGKEYKRDSGGASRVEKVLWVVVESGVVFCILQTVFYAISMASSMSSINSSATSLLQLYDAFIQPFGIVILPFYPTVVFIVTILVGRSS